MINGSFLLFLAFSFSAASQATVISETFDSRADLASGTAVWNQALGMVHPTLQVMNYKASFTPKVISVGDGSDGPFDNTTYASFSAGGDVSGNIIRIDTTIHPVLQVTHFILDAGWAIEPVGNQPLIIES